MTQGALDGLKVLDFSWVIAGPLTTRYLADYGATVIRLESSSRPDVERTSPPFKDNIPGINRSAYFVIYNTNKLSMTLNLKHPEGKKIAIDLIKWADVIVENFTPGVMASFGFDYESLKKIKPDTIMVSLSSYGQDGPYANLPGLGFHTSSLAGFPHFTGWPDRSSQRIGAYCDVLTPYYSVAAILAAIRRRRQTGQGCFIDLSLYETGISFIETALMDFQLNGNPGGRRGNRDADAVPHAAYRCQGDERWLAIAVFNETEWHAFCKASGHTAWAKDARFSSFAARKKNEEALDKLITEWTLQRTAEELFTLLNKAGVKSGIVQNSRDVLLDPQMQHRNLFWLQDHPEVGKHHVQGECAIMSQTPAEQRMPSPCMGEHTEQICREILHLPEDKFIELLSDGVFE
ncbi:MAG TPA: CoA transferase [Dehalococcoidales bacterium]|nr:CoA transferase [Dehalococcoidales bacterium]